MNMQLLIVDNKILLFIILVTASIVVSCGDKREKNLVTLSDFHEAIARENLNVYERRISFSAFSNPFYSYGSELAQRGEVIHHLQNVSDFDDAKSIKLQFVLAQQVHGPAVKIYRTWPERLRMIEWYLVPTEDALARLILAEYVNSTIGPRENSFSNNDVQDFYRELVSLFKFRFE